MTEYRQYAEKSFPGESELFYAALIDFWETADREDIEDMRLLSVVAPLLDANAPLIP
jgi:hypothetical protein